MRLLFSKKVDKYSKNIYKINEFDHKTLENLLQIDDIFGFEVLKSPTQSDIFAFAPSFHRMDLPMENRNISDIPTDGLKCFEIELEKPSFLPLYTEESVNFINELNHMKLDDGIFYTQILVSKHKGKWRNKLISQYEHFLQGNDFPSRISSIRSIQTKLLKAIDKIGEFNFNNNPIVEVEEKILQPNYRLEMRFLINNTDSNEIVNNVTEIFKKLEFYNSIKLYEVKDSEKFNEDILQMRFNPFSKNVYYSESEINSLLGGNIVKQHIINTETRHSTKPNTTYGNLIELLPQAKERNQIIDQSIAKLLESAFSRLNITKSKLKIQSIEQGATLQKIIVTIPKDTTYSQIEKNLKNIQATIGNETVSMEIGDKPETINFYLPCENREIVYLRTLMESEQWKQFSEQSILPFVIGEDSIGNPLFADLMKLVHILIAGATGSGKSVFLNSIIFSFLLSKSPDELHLYLIDPKQVEFGIYEGVPHVKKVITDMDYAYQTLSSLVTEMEKRYKNFSSVGVRNIESFNQKSNNPLSYIITIIDELADLMDTHNDTEELIKRLGQKARAAGIHLIVATQRPSVKVITGDIKANLPSAFSLRLKSQVDYKTVFGKGIPFNLLGNGDGVASIEGNHKEFERFQSPVISLNDDEVADILEELKTRITNYDTEELEINEPESNIDRLKRITASTGETRVAELQKVMGIRINDVSNLMKQLVEENWLEKRGRSYVITASEDELNKWRDS